MQTIYSNESSSTSADLISIYVDVLSKNVFVYFKVLSATKTNIS